MIAASENQYINPEKYLEFEAKSPIKHEYMDGEIYAMAGTTDTHNTIAGNLFVTIRSHLRGTGCRVYIGDVKARLEQCNRFYYPDLLVTCDPQDRETSTYKRFPKLIVEVLSDSTEAFDRGDKFNNYQTLDSLEEYVLVNTRHQRVEIFRRNGEGGWIFHSYTPNHTSFPLSSINLTVSFAELYDEANVDAEQITSSES